MTKLIQNFLTYNLWFSALLLALLVNSVFFLCLIVAFIYVFYYLLELIINFNYFDFLSNTSGCFVNILIPILASNKSNMIGPLRNYSLNNSNSTELDQILFGSLLGDGSLQLPKRGLNAKFGFTQSLIHEEYFNHVFSIFCNLNLCSASFKPYDYFDSRTNKIYTTLSFRTYALPLFTSAYNNWYLNKVKVIPFEFIHLLTPLALAHWIMQDGTYVKNGGIRLSTDSFSSQEVTKLAEYLTTKYNFKCTIHTVKSSNKTKTYHRLYISGYSLPLLRDLVLPYMVPSMLYKLGIK